MKRATSVTQSLTLTPVDQPADLRDLPRRTGRRRGDAPEPVPAVLAFEAADPYAVHLIFPQVLGEDGEPVTWQFARALLIDGLTTATGEGDVMVGPHEAEHYLAVTLVPERDLPLTFLASRAVVTQFVDATFEAVGLGGEAAQVGWDQELAALLGHQVAATFREAEASWRSRPGTLAADPTDHRMVVITVPGSAGAPVTWRISRDDLARKVDQARQVVRARARDVRLEVPGDADLLVGVGVLQEFLLARFTTVLDGAS